MTSTENYNDINNIKLKTDINSNKIEISNDCHDTDNQQFENELLYLNTNQIEISNTEIYKFQKLIEQKYNIQFDGYKQLYEWSIKNNVDFWREFWHYSKIINSKTYDQVLDLNKKFDEIPEWFHGALINYSENLLKYDDDKVAVYSTGEAIETPRSITFKQLRERVRIYQIALKNAGIKKGDRVVGYMPNCIECLEALLATASLGAIWSCSSPDFGAISVLDRFKQIEPKIIFSITEIAYNGKIHDHVEKLKSVVNGISSIEKVILVPFYKEIDHNKLNIIPNSSLLDDFLKSAENDNSDLKFEQVAFNHPLAILYSSGTTGSPKCIVHSHGGTLIQHLKEHMLHGNVNRSDIILYYTTAGWMMYNWLISSLALGTTIVLYDGSPIVPKVDILWDLVDKLDVTMFGTSAKYISLMEDKKVYPKLTHELKKLKIIYSTGSPLKPTSFDYVYNHVKSDLLLCSITGGTDIISLFCGHSINLPVYRGEIQCRQLGMAVECWNDDGKHYYNVCGELVCTKPFPSMPVFFWKDQDNKKYHASYFEKFEGIWSHGDYCMINEITGGVMMFGRSDGTLNPNGVRFGSADIYNVVENFEDIADTLCVGQRNPNCHEEERVVLFVKVNDGYIFNNELETKIKGRIRDNLSPRHVPAIILPITEIPYTLNGKKVEVPVRRIIEGYTIAPSSSLANPNVLDLFKNIESLQKW